MVTVDRRTFLRGVGVAGAAATVTAAGVTAGPDASASTTRVPTLRETHRVIVIGSGFGGGVTALRLAQAGVRVTVLERGIWWRTGPDAETFPHALTPDKRALWHRSAPELFGKPVLVDPYVGLLEAVSSPDMTVVCAAGVGGGSLVYQGMSLQPTREAFHQVLPDALDYSTLDRVHYPRVARMLGLAVAPDSLVATPTYEAARVFASRARAAGQPLDKVPMPIDWRFAQREVEGRMKPSYTNGDLALGVNNGGKHSVDVTYLKQARATGLVDVLTRHEVTDVARAKDGRWTVHVDQIDDNGRVVATKVMTTTALVMAAGTMNTTRLLMRAAGKGLVTDLPDGLGTQWGSNGDRIFIWTDLASDFGNAQGGPVVYCSRDWADPSTANTIIQASIPAATVDLRSTMLVGYGVSRGRGTFTYDSGTDDVVLRFPRSLDASLAQLITRRAQSIVGPFGFLTDTTALLPNTWHPLGGAPMGSVCDLEGRVLGQRGLYVLDGALIPGSTAACNPSLTIAAVAERALDHLVRTDVGTVF